MVSVRFREMILISSYPEDDQENTKCQVPVYHGEEPRLDRQHKGGGGVACVRDALSCCDESL